MYCGLSDTETSLRSLVHTLTLTVTDLHFTVAIQKQFISMPLVAYNVLTHVRRALLVRTKLRCRVILDELKICTVFLMRAVKNLHLCRVFCPLWQKAGPFSVRE